MTAEYSLSDLWRMFSDVGAVAELGIAVASASTLVAFLTLFGQSVFSANRPRTTQGDVQEALEKLVSGDPSAEIAFIDFEDHTRLDELRTLQLRYQKQARRNSLAFNLLVFVQYVIGAVLATSFIPNSSSQVAAQVVTIGGVLGIMVLVSTAIQQRYRPDLLATQAKNRLTRCGRVIREIENGVFKIKTRADDAPSIISLRESASRGIDDLEALELSGMESYYVQRLEVVAQPSSKSAKKNPEVLTPGDGTK
jgi:uncharacterized membrane protein (DUF485 family)